MRGLSDQETETFLLGGGLDLVTPALGVPPGRAIAALNYEPEVRGYRRLTGYERFDGQVKPSEADYLTLNFVDGVYPMAEGRTITGATSSAEGVLVMDSVVMSGSFAADNASGFLGFTSIDGTFADGETLLIAPADLYVAIDDPLTLDGEPLTTTTPDEIAEADGSQSTNAAPTDEAASSLSIIAIEAARDLIEAVPGSGPVRGVWGYADAIWAFRDNVGATAGAMWKATTAGWVQQTFGHTLDFDAGAEELFEGETVNGQTSGATGVIERVVRISGSYDDDDVVGYLVLSGVTGTWQNNENIRVGSTVHAVANGVATAITLPAGGVYDFVNHNFYGASNLRRMYFANGVGRACEWDGTVLAPRRSGLPDAIDKPTKIGVLKDHLFTAYAGGYLQFSGLGEPLSSEVVLGAGDLGLGEDITGLLDSASTALVVFGRNRVAVVEGTDASNFELKTITDDAGAIEWTAQQIGMPTYLDDRGVRKLQTTQSFGNWQTGTLTTLIEPIFKQKAKAGILARASTRVRAKDQYRLFFDDGSGIIIYLGRKSPEILAFDLPAIVRCACSTQEGPAGVEEIFIGADDGFVYQIDSGTSFDGAAVPAFLRLPFNALKSPTREKRFHRAALEVDAAASTSIGLTAEFSYADDDVPPATQQAFQVRGGGGFWDQAFWDAFYWSAPVQGIAEAPIDGLGRNISICVLSEATYEEPHTLSALTLNYSWRKKIR